MLILSLYHIPICFQTGARGSQEADVALPGSGISAEFRRKYIMGHENHGTGHTFRPVVSSILIAVSILGIALLLYVLWQLRSLIGMIVFASLAAYALNPVVSRLERAGVNRTLGIILVTVLMVAMAALVLFLILPALCSEMAELAGNVPIYLAKARDWAISLWERFFGEKFPSDLESFMNALAPQAETLKSLATKAARPVGTLIAGTFGSVVALIGWLIGLAITPVVVFYILRDFDKITGSVLSLIPARRRDFVAGLISEINATLGNLIRGQLLVALVLSVLYCTGLWLIGVPYWPLLGVLSGFAYIVPYLCLVIGFIPSAIVAGFHSQPWWQGPLFVVLLFAAMQALEGFVITPRIVGRKVGLHPLLIILAVLAGGILGGFVGVILAVPLAAVAKVIFMHFYRKIRAGAVEARKEMPPSQQDRRQQPEPTATPTITEKSSSSPSMSEPSAETQQQKNDQKLPDSRSEPKHRRKQNKRGK